MKILFIDHIFHKQTKSSDFFVDILKSFASVDIIYSDPDSKEQDLFKDFCLLDYDRICFWQIMPTPHEISILPKERTILIPMYDACCIWTYKKWSRYKGFKFISFCVKIHNILLDLGISSCYVKYVPKVIMADISKKKTNVTAFIWKRTPNLNLPVIIQMFKRNGVKDFICHGVPENQRYEDSDLNIEYTNGWFKTHNDYINTLSNCHYFFAPRLYEGIGMGFLEAMGLGLCVIAPNQATMNEYIEDNINGYLFDNLKTKSFEINDLNKISENAIKTYKIIESDWDNKRNCITDFIISESPSLNEKASCLKFLFKDIILLYNYRLKYFIKRKLNLLYY